MASVLITVRTAALAFVFFLLGLAFTERTECYFKIDFCDCQMESEKGPVDVSCQKVPSKLDLRHIAKSLSDLPVRHLYVTNSEVPFLSGNVFMGTSIKRLEISSTPLTGLTESDEDAFIGLEKWLVELVLRHNKLTSRVDWSRLGRLNKLKLLDLSFNPLEEITNVDFQSPPKNLGELYLKSCGLRSLGLHAFANMHKLVVLDLSENLLVQVERTMLPQPAPLLQFLYFSYNQIKEFPTAFFSNMTELKTVYVDYNNLHRLPENVWRDLWSNSPQTVDFLGNDIICDVGLCWLTFWDLKFLRGSCSDPDRLRGRRFLTLWPWDVHCNETLYHGNMSLPFKPAS